MILLEKEPASPLGAGRAVLNPWHQTLVGQAVSMESGEVLGGLRYVPHHSVSAEAVITSEALHEG